MSREEGDLERGEEGAENRTEAGGADSGGRFGGAGWAGEP